MNKITVNKQEQEEENPYPLGGMWQDGTGDYVILTRIANPRQIGLVSLLGTEWDKTDITTVKDSRNIKGNEWEMLATNPPYKRIYSVTIESEV